MDNPAVTVGLWTTHSRAAAPTLAALPERERDVFTLIARGLSNSELCDRLVISEATVKTHVNRILAKLGLAGCVQRVALGYECGVV